MPKQTTHYGWDYGVLEIIPGTPKTTKTLCGSRVAYRKIDNTNPSCKVCKALHRLDELTIASLQKENPFGEIAE